MYVVLRKFRDLTDNHIYQKGDIFPFDEREISKARIKELSSIKNKMKVKIIEEVDDNNKKPEDIQENEDSKEKE